MVRYEEYQQGSLSYLARLALLALSFGALLVQTFALILQLLLGVGVSRHC